MSCPCAVWRCLNRITRRVKSKVRATIVLLGAITLAITSYRFLSISNKERHSISVPTPSGLDTSDLSWEPPEIFKEQGQRLGKSRSDACLAATPQSDMNMSVLSCAEEDMMAVIKPFWHLLYKHQHPIDCSKQKFVVLYDWYGLLKHSSVLKKCFTTIVLLFRPWGVGSFIQVAVRQAESFSFLLFQK